MPIVMIVRHPFALAASRLDMGADIDLGHEFLTQPDLVADYLQPFRRIMAGCDTPFERHVAAWCIEVGVPLSQFRDGEICVVFYEHLCTDPAATLGRVLAYLNRPFDSRILSSVRKPSTTTGDPARLGRDWSLGPSGPATSWQQRISEAQRRRGCDVIAAFGMHGLYADSSMPVSDRVPYVPLSLPA